MQTKLIAFLISSIFIGGSSCKARKNADSTSKSTQNTPDCSHILTEAEEVQAIQLSAQITRDFLVGSSSVAARNQKLDELINSVSAEKRNAIRFNILKGSDFAAAAWVFPLALNYKEGSSLTAGEISALAAMGVDQSNADAYLSDVNKYLAPPHAELNKLGFAFSSDRGWSPKSAESLEIEAVKKDKKALMAVNMFFGVEIANQLSDEKREEAIFVDDIVFQPPQAGKVLISKKEEWRNAVNLRLKGIERDSERFVRAAKASTTYSNLMKGRILEWFGAERGHNGKTAPEIELEGAYKALLSQLKVLMEVYGVNRDMRAKLFSMTQVLNDIELQNINEGLVKLEKAKFAAIAAPFIPLVIWVAPYVGTAALGEVWGPVLAGVSAKAALLPLVIAGGASIVTASIRDSNLGGGFMCNLYAQFTERGSEGLISAPFIASIPVVIAGASGAISSGYGLVSSGSLCAKTTFGIINLNAAVLGIGAISGSSAIKFGKCYEELKEAQKNGDIGNLDLVNLHAEKAYQECASGSIDLGFALVGAGRLSIKAYQAIRAKNWEPLLGKPCTGGGSLALGSDCVSYKTKENEKVLKVEELKPLVPESNKLHSNINNDQRIGVIKNVPLDKTTSAPGHMELRKPESVVSMGKAIAQSSDRGREMFKNADKIVLNVFTDSNANVKSIEVMDGNHRFAAGLYAEKLNSGRGWRTIGDIPKEFLEIRVNGFNTNGQQLPRWVPLYIAQESKLPKEQWRFIPPEWGAKGPTAEIPGSVSSLDKSIKEEYRGVTMMQVLRVSLERIGAKL